MGIVLDLHQLRVAIFLDYQLVFGLNYAQRNL